MENNKNNIYLTLSETEKHNIEEKAQELCSLLSIWASCYPIIRIKRAAPVSVLVATVLPNLTVPVSLTVGKLILFIFAVDDVADERLLSYLDFKHAALVWAEIAKVGHEAQPLVDDADLGVILAEIRGELAAYATFSDLGELWMSRLTALCEAMAQEYLDGLQHKAGGDENLPALDRYIKSGIHSVGFPFWGTSVLILLNEPDLLESMNVINEIILETGAAMRLFNDVRTYEKELEENNVNAVTIVLYKLSDGILEFCEEERLSLAKEIVLHLAEQYAEKCYALSSQTLKGTGRFQLMIQRIVAFHAHFYGSHQHNRDYHTLSTTDSFSMIQGS